MKLNKCLSIAIAICSLFASDSNASVSILLHHDRNCEIECDGKVHEFASTKELFNNINKVTSDYFTVDSIKYVHRKLKGKSICLENFNTTDKQCSLTLISDYIVDVMVDCGNNNVKFPLIKMLAGIKYLDIRCDSLNNIEFPIDDTDKNILKICYLNDKLIAQHRDINTFLSENSFMSSFI